MKLDFVCIGAQKAGTTTLHDILSTHEEIYLSANKEILFFDVNERYEQGIGYYENYFKDYEGQKVIGNISPNLQLEERSLDRIIDCYGSNIKVIFIMRDPVYRAYSHYLMSKTRGYEKLSFKEAIEVESERIANSVVHQNYVTHEIGHFEKNHQGYIYRGRYLPVIRNLYRKLKKDQVKILLFEDFVQNREQEVRGVLQFLGLNDALELKLDVESNTASAPRSDLFRNLVNRPSGMIKYLGKCIGPETRKAIRIKLNKLNSRKLRGNEKALSKDEYDEVFHRFFESDIDELAALTQLDLRAKWSCK